LIDLHTHTTASDGRHAPRDLVDRAVRAGVRVLAVTDHDTVAGIAEARRHAEAAGLEFVAGIEITAMAEGADVHVLGYFFDDESPVLLEFLKTQREARIRRVRLMIDLLRAHGIDLDAEAILKPGLADSNKSAGRPWIARALVEHGHVPDVSTAFDRWLGRGCPAFVARDAPPPAEVVSRIHDAGGIASLAHPGLLKRDDWIPPMAASGLNALEVWHSEHDAEATAHYRGLASRLGLAETGGSDFHGGNAHGATHPGIVSMPRDAYDRLKAVANARRPT
jgi:predicted metal-dependent phosphoesterase TrpH